MALPPPVPTAVGRHAPPAPFSPQLSGDLRDQMRRVADALSRKADATLVPTYTAVVLMDAAGVAWRVTVATNGSLQTEQVPR